TFVPALRALLSGDRHAARAEPALLVLVAIAVPPAVAATRFGFFVSEPRYALPLYACVPLFAGALWRSALPGGWRMRATLVAGGSFRRRWARPAVRLRCGPSRRTACTRTSSRSRPSARTHDREIARSYKSRPVLRRARAYLWPSNLRQAGHVRGSCATPRTEC